jgi:hypothetical protein
LWRHHGLIRAVSLRIGFSRRTLRGRKETTGTALCAVVSLVAAVRSSRDNRGVSDPPSSARKMTQRPIRRGSLTPRWLSSSSCRSLSRASLTPSTHVSGKHTTDSPGTIVSAPGPPSVGQTIPCYFLQRDGVHIERTCDVLIATELFRAKRARKETGTLTGTVRGRRSSPKLGDRQQLELSEMLAGSTGLEPAASGVTGRRSNQLNYDPNLTIASRRSVVGGAGLEPATAGV